MDISSMTDTEYAEFLLNMCSIYPGDPTGELQKEACRLLGIEYTPPMELVITVSDAE